MAIDRRQLSHLRADARWCEFREVATNTVSGSRTIRVFECDCRIALRLIEWHDDPVPRPPLPLRTGEPVGK